MIIASFDCGIKNLAICVVQIEKVNNTETKLILDLLSKVRKLTHKLTEYLSTEIRQELDNYYQAVFEYVTSKRFKILYWDNINLFPIDETLKKLKCNNCKRSATVYRTTILGYCKTHIPKDIRCRPIKERSIKTITKKEVSVKLVNALDKIPEVLDVDYVLIEQQPTKNPKMKTLESMLNDYFVIRGIVDKAAPIKDIIPVSPKHKLRGNTVAEKQNIRKLFNESTKNKGYDQRKDVSILRARSILSSEWNKFLDNHKSKADDLCDAFLQAYAYFEVLNNRKLR